MLSPLVVRMVRINILVELVDEAEEVAGIFSQTLLQVSARRSPWRAFAGDAAASECLPYLVVEIGSIGHQEEREVTLQLAPHLLGKEPHGIGFAATLSVPEHTETAPDRGQHAR